MLADLVAEPVRREALGSGAVEHAARFGWDATAAAMMSVYSEALASHRDELPRSYSALP